MNIIIFTLLWSFVGIASIVLAGVIDCEKIHKITLFNVLLIILCGSVFGGIWIVYLLMTIFDKYEETILNIVLWERKK